MPLKNLNNLNIEWNANATIEKLITRLIQLMQENIKGKENSVSFLIFARIFEKHLGFTMVKSRAFVHCFQD